MQSQLRMNLPKLRPSTWARFFLVVIALFVIIALTSCNKGFVTEEKYNRALDSVCQMLYKLDNQVEKLKTEKRRVDTLIIINNKKTENAVKKLYDVPDSDLLRIQDSIKRANGL